jgi:hypothetical protein
MICVPLSLIEQTAKTMPVAYLADCKAASVLQNDMMCFSKEAYLAIRQKYRGYAVSEADRFRKGEIISGCCDRADQY